MSKEVFTELAEATHESPEAVALLFQIMEHQRVEAEHFREWTNAADAQRIEKLEEENAWLRKELAAVRAGIMRLVYPFDNFEDGS